MKKFLLIGIVVLAAIVLSGCQNTAEKAAKTVIESTTNGDVDDGSVTVNTNEGSITVGDNVNIPDNFPSDVYLIDGEIISSLTMDEGQTYQVQIDTPKSLSETVDLYDKKLQDDGWNIASTYNTGDALSIMGAEKDDRMVSVSVNTSDGSTEVTIYTGIYAE